MSLRGQLLIAGPTLMDPNFHRTVVLIAEHTDEGAMGVVLNRPSDTAVVDAVPSLAELVDPGDPVWVGGPVAPQGVVVLAEFDDPSAAGLVIHEDVGFIGNATDHEPLASAGRRARVFAGHAGWGPGQLDGELEEESWITADPEREDFFAEEADELWSRVLERKGGAYALLARLPEDPSVN
jgi:putative transcriptional regulator